MSKFKLDKQKARITNVNLRKEAAGDDEGAALATDIKLECEDLPAAALKALCPVDSGAQLTFADALFNDQGTPRFHGLATLSLGAVFENADVVIAGNRFETAKLKGFEITKLSDNSKVNLVFTVQCHPTEAQVGALAEKIKDEVKVTVEPQPELPLEQDAA